MIGKPLIESLARRFAVLRWRRRNPNYLAVFNFHQVTPTFRPGFHSEWTWTSLAGFEEGLDYLSRRFTVLRLADAQDQLREGRLRGPCAAITFDDGDESVAHYCAPLLEKRGLPATFFINSASLQGDGHYWFSILNHLRRGPTAGRCRLAEAELKHKNDTLRTTTDPALYVRLREEVDRLGAEARVPRRECVSPEWLARLDEGLFEIGAHGHEHQRYAMMTDEWQTADVQCNVQFLRQFPCFRPMFAFPFGRAGDLNEATLRTASECGLAVWGADGGVNVGRRAVVGLRMPADGRRLQRTIVDEMARA